LGLRLNLPDLGLSLGLGLNLSLDLGLGALLNLGLDAPLRLGLELAVRRAHDTASRQLTPGRFDDQAGGSHAREDECLPACIQH
jgi:hypothetical protein